jgi:hypothetical protein
MIPRQGSEEQRLLRFMKVSPKKKMEWIYKMHEFIRLAYSKKQRDIFWHLREGR